MKYIITYHELEIKETTENDRTTSNFVEYNYIDTMYFIRCTYITNFPILSRGSSDGRVVKLLACGARGPGFDSPPRHLNFQRLVISCFQVEIWLKDR